MSPRRRLARIGAALAAVVAALSCGDVPSLVNGVAYYTPVILPLPAVAAGDTLRDSLGRPAPLRIRAFSRDSQEITGLSALFVPTALPADVTIDSATGILVARDTLRTVSLVGQLAGQLQTSPVALQIVPEPSGIARADDPAGDTTFKLPALKALPVTVTGTYRGTSTGVNGIIVRYRIDSLQSTGQAGSATLIIAGGGSLRPDSTIAVDTTRTAGTATRSVLLIGGSGAQRVYISAYANRLRDAAPLSGSPVRFTLDVGP